MHEQEKVGKLLEELGPHAQLNRVYRHDSKNWSLFISDERETFVTLVDAESKLYLSSDVRLPEALDLEAVAKSSSSELVEGTPHLGFTEVTNSQSRALAAVAQFYATLLQYNSLWQESGGYALGLIKTGKIELTKSLSLDNLSLIKLAQAINNFDKQALNWQTVCDNYSRDRGENNSDGGEGVLPDLIGQNHFLKV